MEDVPDLDSAKNPENILNFVFLPEQSWDFSAAGHSHDTTAKSVSQAIGKGRGGQT